MQAGLTRPLVGQACTNQSLAGPKQQKASSLRRNADIGRGLRVVGKASKVEEVGVEPNLSNGSTGTSNPLAFEELTDIIRMVHDTDIVELELKSKRFSLAVRKKEALESQEQTVIYQQAPAQGSPMQYAPQASYAPPPMAPAPSAAPPPSSAGSGSNGTSGPAAAPPAKQDGIEVASPMAGTMYRSPAPGEPPFVKEGDKVTKGQTICIIEAMKLMNEIEAETSGTIVQFLAPNMSAVTIGQPLALIKP